MPLSHIRLVKQIHGTECGAACVAMLGSVSLERARQYLAKGGTQQRSKRTYTEDIRRALSCVKLKLGREVWTSNWANVEKQQGPVLVSLNYRWRKNANGKNEEIWHWAIYDPSAAENPLFDPQSKKSPRKPGPSVLSSYFTVSSDA